MYSNIFLNSLIAQKNIKPTKITVTEGKDAEFVCNTYNSTEWLFNDGDLPENVLLSEQLTYFEAFMNSLVNSRSSGDETNLNTLTIKSVKLANQGNYECEGIDQNGNQHISRGMLIIRSKL